jgi:N-acetylglucosamine-6-phosphate deacetylase
MIALTGADVVLAEGVARSATLLLHEGRIAAIGANADASAPAESYSLHEHLIVPGFVDVHVHGVAGTDTLDEGDAVARIAAALPAFGVTAFCPTTVACPPADLRKVLDQVRRARAAPATHAARVLPAHLESNFISPEYRGAQPLSCLRRFSEGRSVQGDRDGAGEGEFTAADVLQEIERAGGDVGVVTLAPEIDGGPELIAWLLARGVRVSLGHSGATFEQARAAVAAGASRATHLFNRMKPLDHRRPGLAGAVLASDAIAAELICDAVHVHPAIVRATVAAKGASRVMAISDGTAAAALPAGALAQLGGRRIVAADGCARLDDGTMAGSVLTLDAAFRSLRKMGFTASDAATMCATTPARELGLHGFGVVAEGAVADLAVLDRNGVVIQTWIGGTLVYERGHPD